MAQLTIRLAVIIFAVASGCALPGSEIEEQIFVPRREVVAASLFTEGNRLYNSGRFPEAELKYRQVEYLYPGTANTGVNLALALRGMGDFNQSFRILERIVSENSDYLDYRFFLAETYYQAGRYNEAVSQYELLLTMSSEASDIQKAQAAARAMAALSFEIGREEEALCNSRRSFVINSGPADLVRHARILIATAGFTEAEETIKGFLSQHPENQDPAIFKQLALALIGGEKWEEAASNFELAAAQAGSSPDAELAAVGALLESKGRENLLAVGLKAAFGSKDEDEDSDPEEVLASIFKAYNPQSYLYWPPIMVEFVRHSLQEANDE
ncbi:MAG: tetratricopeptide repeat protein [Deltaproteobacteria bacterium]|nr:tetratricopeptide repeat protein [Deltaproteobacteria bacterium]